MIDAHVHFWRIARGDNFGLDRTSPLWRDHEPAELAPQLAAAGVDRILVVAAAETHAENLYTIGLAAAHRPLIAGVVPWIDLQSPALPEEVAAYRGTGSVRGFRPVKDGNASIAWMLDARLKPGCHVLAEAGLPVDILIENPDELSVAMDFAKQNPNLVIILDHCGKPDIDADRFHPWARDLATLAALPNVVCKFSGLLARARPGAGAMDVRRYSDHVLESFGPRRLMWASDWPPLTRNSTYATWREVSGQLLAGLAPDERAAIEEGTATEIYRLQGV